MTSEQSAYYRDRLKNLQDEIRNSLDNSSGDTDVVEIDTAIGRLSRMDAMQNQQLALELKRRKEQRLQRIGHALKNLEKGSYGVCGKCKQSIDENRLEVQPDAVMCIRCAG